MYLLDGIRRTEDPTHCTHPETAQKLFAVAGCVIARSGSVSATLGYMAQKVVTLLTDDIDGGEATETIAFALEGTSYEIDLSRKNADKLRKAIKPFVDAARKVRGSRRGRRSSDGRGQLDTKAIREWAAASGVKVSSRGRIPTDVIKQYQESH